MDQQRTWDVTGVQKPKESDVAQGERRRLLPLSLAQPGQGDARSCGRERKHMH